MPHAIDIRLAVGNNCTVVWSNLSQETGRGSGWDWSVGLAGKHDGEESCADADVAVRPRWRPWPGLISRAARRSGTRRLGFWTAQR